MGERIKGLQQSSIENIAKILGDTSTGFTGSQIGQYLFETKIKDVNQGDTKWRRLYSALVNNQNELQCSNGILTFLKHTMDFKRYINDESTFQYRRSELNKVLSCEGYVITESGGLGKVPVAKTISEAKQRTDNFRAKLQMMNVHIKVFQYCKEELLAENYFHAVLEAAKSIFDRIREISGTRKDGASLVQDTLFGTPPMLIINDFITESEQSEQKGFANFLIGVFGMFRNTTAHSPKIKWAVNEEDAIDAMIIISHCHKKIDSVQKLM